MKKKGFTLIELLVVIAIIAMLMAILMPALGRVRRLAQRLICGTNLKGLGTAVMVYANDNDEEYPIAGHSQVEWADYDGQGDYWDETEDFNWDDYDSITTSASLYLLVREADVSPKQFVCQSSDQKEFEGSEADTMSSGEMPDLTDLHDFGGTESGDTKEFPSKCVSYAYQLPYQDGASDGVDSAPVSSTDEAGMVIMADKNPWLDPSLIEGNPTSEDYMNYVALLNDGSDPGEQEWDSLEKWEEQIANSNAHMREGQNALFNDGHVSFEKRSDIGVKNDNIYTQQKGDGTNPTQSDMRIGGANPKQPGHGNVDVKTRTDNVLVNDDDRNKS